MYSPRCLHLRKNRPIRIAIQYCMVWLFLLVYFDMLSESNDDTNSSVRMQTNGTNSRDTVHVSPIIKV